MLPWKGCASVPPWVGGRHADKTINAVSDLLLHLRPADSLAWGGDWNHALTGREYAGSQGGRRAILAAIGELGLVVATAQLPHAIEGLLCIDHIAVSAGCPMSTSRIVAEHDGNRLSDHDAYVAQR